VKNTKHITAS